MAGNPTNITTIVDSTKRLCVKITGTTANSNMLIIQPQKLNYALNANGIMMSTLGQGTVTSDVLPCYTLYLNRALYDVKSGDVPSYVSINNDANTLVNSNIIATFGWSGEMAFNDANWSATINCATGANCTGNIYLSSVGFTGNSAYTILLDFRKEPRHFSQGQQNDPVAFNQGPARGAQGS